MARYNKKSIRFFNNREVRAVWDEEQSKWWFSATDVVRAINDEDDYTKSRNYWKYLKGKLMKAGIEVVSATNQFKFEAPDGKMRTADVLDADSVQIIACVFRIYFVSLSQLEDTFTRCKKIFKQA